MKGKTNSKHPWVGHKVDVYEDPVTREKLEGVGLIVTVYDLDHIQKGSLVSVQFLDMEEGEPTPPRIRWIQSYDIKGTG